MPDIRDLTFAYGDKVILKGVNASFPARGSTCIVGASGSGKTTLLRVLAGLEQPTSGDVSDFRALRISASFQTPRLLPHVNVLDNVAIAAAGSAAERRAAAMEALSLFAAEDLAARLPETLSGGQKQRVSLARAFAAPGDVLLLDEPTTGLDAELRRTVLAAIRKESERRHVIFVSHGEEERLAADAVLEL